MNEHRAKHTTDQPRDNKRIQKKLQTLQNFYSKVRTFIIPILILSILTFAIYSIPKITPDYQPKVAVRTMITNSIGLIALLTFTVNTIANISKDRLSGNATYLGVDINSFHLIQSQATRAVSHPCFTIGIFALFALPILEFELEYKFNHLITSVWWSIFILVSSSLALFITNTLHSFTSNVFNIQSTRNSIRNLKQNQWFNEINEMSNNDDLNSIPEEAYSLYTTYLDEYENLSSEERETYKYITLNVIKFAESRMDSTTHTLFFSGRLMALIKKLENSRSSDSITNLLELYIQAVRQYDEFTSTINSDPSVDITEEYDKDEIFHCNLLDAQEILNTTNNLSVDAILAISYTKIFRNIEDGNIRLRKNDIAELFSSVSLLRNQSTQTYVAGRAIDAIITGGITNYEDPRKPTLDVAGILSKITNRTHTATEYEMLLTKLTNFAVEDRLISAHLSFKIRGQLLELASINSVVADYFIQLFRGDSFDDYHFEHTYLAAVANNIRLNYASREARISGDKTQEQRQSAFYQSQDSEVLQLILKHNEANPSTKINSLISGSHVQWLLSLLAKEMDIRVYREFKKHGVSSLYSFRYIILWKTIVAGADHVVDSNPLSPPLPFFTEDTHNAERSEISTEVSAASSILKRCGCHDYADALQASLSK